MLQSNLHKEKLGLELMWPSLDLLASWWPVFEPDPTAVERKLIPLLCYSEQGLGILWGRNSWIVNGDPSPWLCLCTMLIGAHQFSQPVMKSCFQMENS